MIQKLSTRADLAEERERLGDLIRKHAIGSREFDQMAKNLNADVYYIDFVSLKAGTFGLARIGDVKPVVEAIVAARRAAETQPDTPSPSGCDGQPGDSGNESGKRDG